MSPYNFSDNNPVMMVDPDGNDADIWLVNAETGETSYVEDGSQDVVVLNDMNYTAATSIASGSYNENVSRIAGFIYDAAISRGDRLVANADGMVELPADNPNSRNGSYTFEGKVLFNHFNRNDESGPEDQWGEASVVADLIGAVVEYNQSYSDVVNIGDMKSPGNGMVNAGWKYHHGDAGAFDARFLGDAGSINGGGRPSMVNVQKTQAFINALGNHNFTRIILPGDLRGRGLHGSGSMSIKWDMTSGHDNHYHVDRH